MNDQIQRELQKCIEEFANNVTGILQKAVADAVAAVLAATEGSSLGRLPVAQAKKAAPKKSKKSKSAQKTRVAKPAKSAAPKATRTPASTRGGAPFDAQSLLREVERKPGQRMEELAKKLRTTTKRLAEPMKTLLAANAVKKAGLARGTTYRPSQSNTSKSAPEEAAAAATPAS
jgi:hypothetical protein